MRTERETFIGRDAELASLGERFEAGAPLVTVTGEPGIGKSALARRWVSAFDGMTAVAGLTGVSEPREVLVAVAAALSLRDSSPSLGSPRTDLLSERVLAALETGEVDLLLLDDAEHAVEALAELLPQWRAAAPSLRVLVATRRVLRLASEQVLELGGLGLPADESPRALESSDAVRLLEARASELELDGSCAPWIARLVRQLDGNPLALELAGARLRSLGLQELTERLARGLDLLDRGLRDGPERHASLRRAIDASWSAADEGERALLSRCSLFGGWFDVGAVEAVAEDVLVDPLDALHRARERSLVKLDRDGPTARYALSSPIRAFARERLAESGHEPEARERHARWLAGAAEEVAARWRRSGGQADLEWLRAHQGDFATATQLRGAETLPVRARLVLAFDPVLRERERAADHAAIMSRLESEPGVERLDPSLRARLGLAHARVHERAGEPERGLAALEEARERATDPDLRAAIDIAAAELHQAAGRLDEAERACRRILEQPEIGDARRGHAMRSLGLVAHARGALDEAHARYRDASRLAVDAPLLAARLSSDLGSVRLQQRRLDEAEALYRRALDGSADAPDPVTVGLTEGNLAILAQERGRFDEAAARFERARRELEPAGHRLYAAHLTLYAAFLEQERARPDRAAELHERALATLERVGDRRMAGLALAGLGAARAERGQLEAAREAFDEAAARLDAVGDAGLELALALHGAQLPIAEAERMDDADEARALRESAGAALEAADPELLSRSDDARFAERLLRRRLARGAVRVTADGAWIRLADGAEVDLSRREVLRRLFLALVEARRDTPGTPVGVDALIERGWPDERMSYESGLNRLKVALSTLRKLGLRPLITRRGDGYLLDPARPVLFDA